MITTVSYWLSHETISNTSSRKNDFLLERIFYRDIVLDMMKQKERQPMLKCGMENEETHRYIPSLPNLVAVSFKEGTFSNTSKVKVSVGIST